MEKTLEIHLAEQRESIATAIEGKGERMMTHDELLAKIDEALGEGSYTFTISKLSELLAQGKALRAVVELTAKYEEFDGVDSAGMSGYRLAMKQVIQAIEKELK